MIEVMTFSGCDGLSHHNHPDLHRARQRPSKGNWSELRWTFRTASAGYRPHLSPHLGLMHQAPSSSDHWPFSQGQQSPCANLQSFHGERERARSLSPSCVEYAQPWYAMPSRRCHHCGSYFASPTGSSPSIATGRSVSLQGASVPPSNAAASRHSPVLSGSLTHVTWQRDCGAISISYSSPDDPRDRHRLRWRCPPSAGCMRGWVPGTEQLNSLG